MGSYDAAVKVILSHCRQAALEYFLGLEVVESEVVELPQETATLRRSDFPIRVRTPEGRLFIVLLEVQSRWEHDLPLRLLEYDARYRLKTGLSVLPAILLLTPSGAVVERFEDEGLRYAFRVISLAALEARDLLRTGNPCLFPFAPLMKGGVELFDEAERALTDSMPAGPDRADLLTGMALLSGLVSKELPQRLLSRRRDIMMESVAYEMIKKEGYDEGLQQGMQQGMQQGLQKGIQQGMLADAREMVLEALAERFGPVPADVEDVITTMESRRQLKELLRFALRVKNIHEFRNLLTSGL
uniref:Transposase (putative) YhgA-like domain-containing protein n=1 Tax=Desulfacinum infernum TaxID=35837 RepID=A0A832EDH7_9BACT